MILRLDVDRGRRLTSVVRLMWLLRRAGYHPVYLMQTRSPGGKGWHLEIQTRPPIRNRFELVALQAILGSDVAREACNLTRARMVPHLSAYWRDRWNVLYG